ncbi:MAG: hypothetical protein ACLTZT_01640 [Butyricimonas faecalis]
MENIDEIIMARLAKESFTREINSLDEWLSQSKSHKHIYSRLETMAERGNSYKKIIETITWFIMKS